MIIPRGFKNSFFHLPSQKLRINRSRCLLHVLPNQLRPIDVNTPLFLLKTQTYRSCITFCRSAVVRMRPEDIKDKMKANGNGNFTLYSIKLPALTSY